MYEKIKKYFEKESGKNDERRAKEVHQVVIKYQSILYKNLIDYYRYQHAETLFPLEKKIKSYWNCHQSLCALYAIDPRPKNINQLAKNIEQLAKDETNKIPLYEKRIEEMLHLDSKEIFEKVSDMPLFKETIIDESKLLKSLKQLLNVDFNLSANIDSFEGLSDEGKLFFYLSVLYIFFDLICDDDFSYKVDELKLLKLTISINYLIKRSTSFIFEFDTSGKISDRILKSKIPRKKVSKYKQAVLEEYILIADRDGLSDNRIGQILAAKLKKQFPDNEKMHSKEKIPSGKTIIRWLKAEGFRQK